MNLLLHYLGINNFYLLEKNKKEKCNLMMMVVEEYDDTFNTYMYYLIHYFKLYSFNQYKASE